MKKSMLSIGILLILSLLLMACGDNEEVENPPENAGNENQESQAENGQSDQQQADENNTNEANNTDTNTENGYGFISFDLEADFAELDDALDVDFENEPNDEMEATYHYRAEGFDLRGDEAMEELDSIFSSFNFDENTADEEVLNEVSEAFNIPEDVKNIELEIDFGNGTEKEYRK